MGDDDKKRNCNVGKVWKDVLQEDKGSDADLVEQELRDNHVDGVEEGGEDGHQRCQSSSTFLGRSWIPKRLSASPTVRSGFNPGFMRSRSAERTATGMRARRRGRRMRRRAEER